MNVPLFLVVPVVVAIHTLYTRSMHSNLLASTSSTISLFFSIDIERKSVCVSVRWVRRQLMCMCLWLNIICLAFSPRDMPMRRNKHNGPKITRHSYYVLREQLMFLALYCCFCFDFFLSLSPFISSVSVYWAWSQPNTHTHTSHRQYILCIIT